MGLSSDGGWLAYLRDQHLFLKLFDYVEDAIYPDFGCSVEVYTRDTFLEVETLGPLQKIAPGGIVEHIERWFLFREVKAAAAAPLSEETIEKVVLPLVAEAKE